MKKVFYLLVFISLIAASCSNEDKQKDNAQMSINSCYVLQNNTELESFNHPIGMYILNQKGNPYEKGTYYANYESGNWHLNEPVYVSEKGSVYAYFPYKSSDVLPELSIDMTKQEDLLYSKLAVAIAPGSSALSIKLYHALSQLSVSVAGEKISSVSLYSPVRCKFNICSGAFTDSTMGNVTSQSDKILVIPHTAAGTDLIITLQDGKQYSYSLEGAVYRSGENYTYQFQLNDNREKLEIVSFTVEDWINDEIYNDYLR